MGRRPRARRGTLVGVPVRAGIQARLLICLLVLAGCRQNDGRRTEPSPVSQVAVATEPATAVAPTGTPRPQTRTPAVATPAPSPTATLTPVGVTVCMGRRPDTLYLYGNDSPAAVAIRSTIYEDPFTRLDFAYQPRGVEKLPSLADGDAVLTPVMVALEERVVDASGNVVRLRPGVTVVDSKGQVVAAGDGPVEMAQLSATFTLRPLVWSDGVPVTAADSVFSFELAAAGETNGSRRQVQRTARYEAVGPLTVRWTGLPGNLDPDFMTRVWAPLPSHQLGAYAPEAVAAAPEVMEQPLSSGPFVVVGQDSASITLTRNPHYTGGDSGRPRLDRIEIRFLAPAGGEMALPLEPTSLPAECDVVTQDALSVEMAAPLEAGGWQVLTTPGVAYEHVDFGINSYLDAGFENFARPDWFEDSRVRQAITLCTDRAGMAQEIMGDGAAVMAAYIPAGHPLFPEDLAAWPYDPAAANQLLDEAGFVDGNGDGVRESPGGGAPFAISLTTDDENLVRRRAAERLQADLRTCGIDVTLTFLPPADWYNDGPLGLLFGRRFDLAMFAWLAGPQPACQLWLTQNITGPEAEGFGGWGNVNVSGWSDPAFDNACTAARRALPGTEAYVAGHQNAMRIWWQQLPMMPLFAYVRVTAVRPEVTGLAPNVSQPGELWNIASWTREQ